MKEEIKKEKRKCCNNKAKKLAMLLLMATCVGLIVESVLLYLTGFLRINGKTFKGEARINKWEMDYASFSIFISYATYAGLGVGVFGLLAAKVKKPVVSFLFVIIALGGAGCCYYSSMLAIKYKVNNREDICDISDDGPAIIY